MGLCLKLWKSFRKRIYAAVKPDSITLASFHPDASESARVNQGKEIHCYIICNGVLVDLFLKNALIDMYFKCRDMKMARNVFNWCTSVDIVICTAMISGYALNGMNNDALEMFRCFLHEQMNPNAITLSSCLPACAGLTALKLGKELHGSILKNGLERICYVGSVVSDMYAKCGNLEFSCSVFDVMEEKNEVSWNSIIAAYGNHGHLEDCLSLFHEMEEKGFRPDHVTFLAIISACGHAGLVDEGKQYFKCMEEDYGIAARMQHYACIIDLFGRAGRLKEAFEAIESIPFDPDAGVWGSLLGACHVHGNVELVELTSRHLFENSGYYVLLSNVQANAGKWEGVNKTRSMMKNRGVEKVPGYSWIEELLLNVCLSPTLP